VNTTNAPIDVVYLINTTANGCPGAPFSYTVKVSPTAVVTSPATGTACSGVAQAHALASNVTGATFSWTRPVVSGISNAAVTNVPGSTISEALVNTTTVPVPVTYTITPYSAGCPGTPATYTVTVYPTAKVISGSSGAICSNSPVNYNILSDVTGATFRWSRAAVTGISNASVTNQGANPIGEVLVNTGNAPVNVVYAITPIIGGCDGTPFTYTVTVSPVAVVTSAATTTVCSGSFLTYPISSNVAGATFSWSRAARPEISNPAVSGQLTPTISETLVNTTNSPVVVTYTIIPVSGACNGIPFTLDVTVNPKPTASFTATPTSACVNGPVNFSSVVSPNVATYSWNFGDGSARSTDAAPVHTYPAGGSYDVSLTVTTAAGCTFTTATQPVNLLPLLPKPVVLVDATTASLNFRWAAVTGATGYEVSFDGGATFSAPNGTGGLSHLLTGLSPQQTFTIIVRAFGAVDCQRNTGTLTTTVPLPDVGIFVPNTISPNGDGKNESLKVMGNNIKQYTLKVYNQWGQQLYAYDGADTNKGWDGTVSGSQQPAGVYAYAVSVTMSDGRIVTKKGLFNLLR
jgi:gliding motility-associated-like protein